jgi:hypothetical protein
VQRDQQLSIPVGRTKRGTWHPMSIRRRVPLRSPQRRAVQFSRAWLTPRLEDRKPRLPVAPADGAISQSVARRQVAEPQLQRNERAGSLLDVPHNSNTAPESSAGPAPEPPPGAFASSRRQSRARCWYEAPSAQSNTPGSGPAGARASTRTGRSPGAANRARLPLLQTTPALWRHCGTGTCCWQAPQPHRSTIRRTGRVLTPSIPLSSSALARRPPQPSWRIRASTPYR